MFQKLCCAAALATATTGAADAAVFRYDLTLSLSSASIGPLFGMVDLSQDMPPLDADCDDDPEVSFCRVSSAPIDTPLRFPSELSGSVTLESFEGFSFGLPSEGVKSCVGTFCFAFANFVDSVSARENGFDVASSSSNGETRYAFSEAGLRIDQPDFMDLTIDGTVFFSDAGTESTFSYTTTDLTITPLSAVPLPAGMLLLPSALALLGWRRRHAARAA